MNSDDWDLSRKCSGATGGGCEEAMNGKDIRILLSLLFVGISLVLALILVLQAAN